jgi:hypothetical protein
MSELFIRKRLHSLSLDHRIIILNAVHIHIKIVLQLIPKLYNTLVIWKTNRKMENIKLSWVATPRGVRDHATTALLCSEPIILNLG